MEKQKSYGFIIAGLVVLIAATILVVLSQTGRLGSGGTGTTAAGEHAPVVRLDVQNGVVAQIDVTDFIAFIESADQPVFVDFWAAWCGPCRSAAPFIEQLAQEYAGKAIFLKVDVDRAPDLAARYKAQSIPLFIVFSGGKPVDQTVGYSAEYQDVLRAMIDGQLP